MKPKTPKTRAELESAGYEYERKADCRGCGAAIFWYRSPLGRRMPFDAKTLAPHWPSCPQAKEFQGKGLTTRRKPK